MAIAFRSASNAGTGSTANANPGEPTGTVSGDVLIGGILVIGTSAAPSLPTGWTTLYTITSTNGTSVNGFKLKVGYIVRGASAAATTFTNAAAYREAVILSFSGVNTTTPIDSQSASGTLYNSVANPNPPASTAVSSAAMAVTGIAHWAGASWVAPTGYTLRSPSTAGLDLAFASKLLSASGSEDPAAFTGNPGATPADGWNGFTITLAPAAAGGTTVTDTPSKGLRSGSVPQTVTFGATVTDSPSKGVRAGSVPQSVAIGRVFTDAPSGRGLRGAASATERVAIGRVVTDTPAGTATRSGAVRQTLAIGRVIADAVGSLRLGSVRQTVTLGTAGAVTVTDRPFGVRLFAQAASAVYGLVVGDTPRGVRLFGRAGSVSIGTTPPVQTSFTFRTPTLEDRLTDPSVPLLGRYHIQRGVSVFLRDGHYIADRYPDYELQDGSELFIGGHEYTVNAALAAALTADGFGAYLS